MTCDLVLICYSPPPPPKKKNREETNMCHQIIRAIVKYIIILFYNNKFSTGGIFETYFFRQKSDKEQSTQCSLTDPTTHVEG